MLFVCMATTIVMILIIIIWLTSFSRNVKKPAKEEFPIPSLFESIKIDFSALKQQLDASMETMNQQINESELKELEKQINEGEQ